MGLSIQEWVNILSALGSFAGGFAAIIGAGAAVIAVIFAWENYKKIQDEVKKQGDQIGILANIAIEVSHQNNLIEERIRFSVMPIIYIVYAGNQGRYFGEGRSNYKIKNTGKNAFELNIKLPDTKKTANHIKIFQVLEENGSEIIRVPFPNDNMREFEGLDLEMTFRDSFYNWYHQKARIEKKYTFVENSPPQLVNSDESFYKKFYSDRAKRD